MSPYSCDGALADNASDPHATIRDRHLTCFQLDYTDPIAATRRALRQFDSPIRA